jgi:hypothetical protein
MRTDNFMRLAALIVLALCVSTVSAQDDKKIAAQFAPVFAQGLGDKPEYDYITRFDFDGDWRGDNNWANADKHDDANAWIYYYVSETATHYFVHYAAFHPRDYKGGSRRGALLGELLREGAGIVKERDPTGLLNEVTLAHENDLEGCLVVAEKNGGELASARVVYVETLSHNQFKPYQPAVEGGGEGPRVLLEDSRPRLYIEPKGHGIEAFPVGENNAKDRKVLVYKYGGKAESAARQNDGEVGYDLLPLSTTIWPRAAKAPNITFGAANDYGTITLATASGEKKVKIGTLGMAFLGKVGAPNAARAPWGWFDLDERDQPLGQWFFDPARVIQRHFKLGEKFSLAYTRHPLFGIGVK